MMQTHLVIGIPSQCIQPFDQPDTKKPFATPGVHKTGRAKMGDWEQCPVKSRAKPPG